MTFSDRYSQCLLDSTAIYQQKGDQSEVSTAYRKGKAMAIADVATSLYEQAKNGNIHAAKFYLKTQAGWREDAPVELYQPDDDRTWKIRIMRAKEDGTTEPSPTGRVIELESD